MFAIPAVTQQALIRRVRELAVTLNEFEDSDLVLRGEPSREITSWNPIGSFLFREEDLEILGWIEAMILRSKTRPVSVLEVGCGPTKDIGIHNRGPWLSRALKRMYGEKLAITVSDAFAFVQPDLEHEFGLSVVPAFNYLSPRIDEPLDTYDFIFARHQAQFKQHLEWNDELLSEEHLLGTITERVSSRLRQGGFSALFFCESGNIDTTPIYVGEAPIQLDKFNLLLVGTRQSLYSD